MFSFAMDCLFAGMALCLLVDAMRALIRLDDAYYRDFIWISAAFGMGIFLISRFLMSFVIMWGAWE